MRALESLSWSLRRLRLPVDDHALVLEVGSGGNPFPRANVLLDAYEESQERHWEPLVRDRPTVLGFGENLPFRDKAFDFVIAAHVLEHSTAPERFLAELERVAPAGYIETPDAFMERVNPYKDHRLEVTLRDDCLLIRKKEAWIHDPDLVELYEQRAKRWLTQETIPGHPAEFHVRYFWKDKIRFRIVNPQADASWPAAASHRSSAQTRGLKSKIRHAALGATQWLFSQRARNRHINLMLLLRCPGCHGLELSRQESVITCNDCGAAYEVRQGMFVVASDQRA